MFEIIRVEREPESFANRLGRQVMGWALAIIGVAILLLFIRATVTEVMDGTFFGLTICLMMLVFGALVTRDGVSLAINLRVRLKPWD